MIAGSASTIWWWWPNGSAPGQRPVLFFPPAGADQTIAGPLVRALDGVRLGVLRMPGRGPRSDEPSPSDIAAVVAHVAASLEPIGGPAPVLVGHSFGGLLAFAVAQELDRRLTPPARLIAVASVAPHAWAGQLARSGAADREDYASRRTDQLMADGAVPAGITDHPELGPAARTSLRVDVRLSYHPFDLTPVFCPITAVFARDDPLVDRSAWAGWPAATSSRTDRITVPGDHFFYRADPQLLGRLILGEVGALDGGYHLG